MRILITGAFLFFYSLGYGQRKVISYTTFSGLPHNITYGIYQDQEGYIWIGTDKGAAKFDGDQFQNISIDDNLNNNYVIDISQDSQGAMLYATWGGGLNIRKGDSLQIAKHHPLRVNKLSQLFLWDNKVVSPQPKTNYFSVFKKNQEVYEQSIRYVNMSSDGNVWISEVSIEESEEINVDFSLVDHDLLLHQSTYARENITPFKGVYYFKDKRIQIWKNFLKDIEVSSVFKVSDSLYGAFSESQCIIFNKDKIVKSIPLEINKERVTKALLLQNDNYFLLTSDRKGYRKGYILDQNFQKPTSVANILNSKVPISDVIEDVEGNIWISTYGEGVFCLVDALKFKQPKLGKLKNINIVDFQFYNGNTYLLSTDKLYMLDEKEAVIDRIPLEGISTSLTLKEDSLLIGSLNVEKKLSKVSQKIFQKGSSKFIYKDGIPVQVYKNSVYYLEQQIEIEERVTINDVAFINKEVWVATDIGIYIYSNECKFLKKMIKEDGLLSNNIIQIEHDKNNTYIATNKGLQILKEGEFFSFTERQGLVDNYINTIYVDGENIWIGTSSGLSVWNKHLCKNLNEASGLASSFISCIKKDQKGRFWLGTNKGVSIIDSYDDMQQTSPPLLKIKREGNSFIPRTVSFDRPKDISLEFTLDQQNWVKTFSKKPINISDYKEGLYNLQFRAKKIDSDWVYSNSYTIEIKSPWYKRGEMIFLLTTLTLLPILILYKNRLKKTKKRNSQLEMAILKQKELEKNLSNVREHIAQDFHDELGNIAAGISIMANKTYDELQNNTRSPDIYRNTQRISKDANILYEGIRDFIWTLDDKNHTLKELIIYLTDYGLELFEESAVKFQIDNKIEGINIKLPNYWNRHILLIFKEAFLNTYKYSGARQAKLIFSIDSNNLHIIFSDNGKGFDLDKVKKGNGVRNMKSRAEKIYAKVEVSSSDKGTKVVFRGSII